MPAGKIAKIKTVEGWPVTPVNGSQTFTILTSNQALLGAFDNVANGGRLNTADGFGSFQVNYGSGSLFGAQSVVVTAFVPEPSAALLLTASLAVLGLRRTARRPS